MSVDLRLHPKQSFAWTCGANDIGFGGAVGGGKSFFLRAAAITFCTAIPRFNFGLFRRNEGELLDTHVRGRNGFYDLLAEWIDEKLVKVYIGKEPRIEFLFNGSTIRLCHCSDLQSWKKYLSYEFNAIGIDESTTFTVKQKSEIRNRLRTAIDRQSIPEDYRDMLPWICEATNPGGISSHDFKSRYVNAEANKVYELAPGVRKIFVPSLLEDNPTLSENDPAYEFRLKQNNTDARYRALRFGEWVTEGAYFPEYGERNIIEPFPIPDHWYKFRAMDWGFASPFSIGWYAIAAETINHPDGRVIKRGCLVKYREWYGIETKDDGSFVPNQGVRLTADVIAQGIVDRGPETIQYGVLDPSAFAEDGGPSHAETMGNHGVHWLKADNKRVGALGALGGWDQMRQRIRGDLLRFDGDEPVYDHPMLMVTSNCFHTNRTIPEVQHSETFPEDVEKKGEDHCADETRYACMSRPIAGPTNALEENILQQPSISDLIRENARQTTIRRI